MGASLGSCLSACRNKHIASVADAVVRFFFCKSLGSGWIWMNLLVFLLLVVVLFEYISFFRHFFQITSIPSTGQLLLGGPSETMRRASSQYYFCPWLARGLCYAFSPREK